MTEVVSHFLTLNKKNQQILCHGDWTLPYIAALQKEVQELTLPAQPQWSLNGKDLTKMDSAGAWILIHFIRSWRAKNKQITLQEFSQEQEKLIDLVDKETQTTVKVPKITIPNWLAQLGMFSVGQFQGAIQFLSFTGQLTLEAIKIMFHPARIRWNAIASTIYTTGYQALPIIALLSYMIGVVISYQMGNQLRNYGANVFIVNLLGFSILREFGPLLTAIMLAGRTGSAFTAQLGIMNINQEMDALNTMGVTPGELLLLPRLIGLTIALPLLTVWSDIFGVLGGIMMANNMLDISWHEFLMRFQKEIPVRNLIIGLGKAPIFALIIGGIGCFEGMKVHGSATSLGERTTRSVVLAIFFIIITDALFSVLFSKFDL